VHDPDFRQAEKDWFSFVEKLTERLVEIDDTVPELPVKDIVSCSPHRVQNDYTRHTVVCWALQNISLTLNRTDLPHLSRCPVL
jgi:hypothetical protein